MSRLASLLLLTSLAVSLSACGLAPYTHSDGASRGAPESLLDVSSEVVNLSVQDGRAVDELAQWVERDQPTRAELYCAEGEKFCREARQALELYGVPTTLVPSQAATATLVYERVLARDCSQKYVDDLHAYHNQNHPAFGCSVAANIVQHVSQKQQFISPNLSDYRDAETAVNNYNNYQSTATRSAENAAGQFSLDNSTLSNAQQ